MAASEQDAAVMKAYPDLFGPPKEWQTYPVTWSFELGPGWRPIVLSFLERLREVAAADGTPVQIRQVKEKLGELRVYVRGGGKASRAAIRAAEEEASRTCEVCDASGRLRRDCSYIQVLCDLHAYVPPSVFIRAVARRSGGGRAARLGLAAPSPVGRSPRRGQPRDLDG